MIDKGAEAKIYAVDIFGKEVLAKERTHKNYRIRELDEKIREMRTKNEARIILAANKSGINAPKLIATGKYTLFISRIQGKLLRDSEESVRDGVELGRQLALLHDADIAHGDFTPANVMVSKGEIAIIDFGLSEITTSIEEKAIDLHLMKRSAGKAFYLTFSRSYAKHSKNAKQVIARLEDIEKRGRYQNRTLS